MRSKQQPRPSYRWLNKEENDEAESTQNKEVLRSGSTSPSSSSVHSSENISSNQIVTDVATVENQLLPPTLVAAAAAAAAVAATAISSSSIDQSQSRNEELSQQIRLSDRVPSQTTVSIASSSSPSPYSSTATSPLPIDVNSCSVTSAVAGVVDFRPDNTAAVSVTNPLLNSTFASLLHNSSEISCPSLPLSTAVPFSSASSSPSLSPTSSPATIEAVKQDQQHMKTVSSSSASITHFTTSSSSAFNRNKSSGTVLTTINSTTPINSNLIDSHDDLEHTSSKTSNNPNISQTLLIKDPSAERELASPRCQSRDSSSGGRCPSDDSNYSGNGSTTAPTPTSPVGITLPATLPPAAAAALLPPQSAAMAAYLNVAAAAAQQNRLLLGNPLAAAAGLVRAAQSPPTLPLSSPIPDDAPPILDFSTKRNRRDSDTDSKSDSDAVNLSKSDNGPLDLSVGSRKRNAESDVPPPTRKMPRPTDYKSVVSPWTSPITPYFAAAVAAASLSPKNPLPSSVDWNGKNKIAPNDATKALEKMSEMTRLGGPENEVTVRPTNNQTSSVGSGRHSAWQSHWLNKGADAAKDVFKCVWCKQSFPTLATLTTHMKETQHCGVNVPPSGNLPATGGQAPHHHHHHQPPTSTSSNSSSNKSDLNLLIKETMPLPRKLVRGQDVWLGKGAEQTRQILKCMWCGQSFRSLAEMTSHMQQTQHYTNIISQEQIISWKSSEDGKSGGQGGSGTGGSSTNSSSGPNSTVSAVLTCKVCDQAFSSLKDLSNHMVKNAHYKEHIMRSITESGGRRRQTREKRKKSLPVRKLLELERAQHDFKNGEVKPMRDIGSTRITCEKCGEKIETALFVEHIRKCVGGSIPNSPRGMLSANSIIPPDSMSPLTPSSRDGRKSIGDESTSPASNRHISPHASDLTSPSPKENANNSSSGEKMSSPSVLNAIEQLIEKSFDTRTRHGSAGFSSNNHSSAPLGSSILKRLGIDESVDYTKPLIDPQTMNLLRSYQQQHYSKRERSGSESSSVSDRGSSRLESLTPERKPDLSNHVTPRQSPDKNMNHQNQSENEEDTKESIKIKREPEDDESSIGNKEKEEKISVKKEFCTDDNFGKEGDGELDLSSKPKTSTSSSLAVSPSQMTQHVSSAMTSSTPAASPCSDRSTTPRSTGTSTSEKKVLPSSGSLNALSSMFDSLTAAGSAASNSSEPLVGHNSSKKGSSHPLAALQKLCDKTENTIPNSRSGSTGTLAPNIPPTGATASGNILAFSWACNDAVMTSDSIIKCAFCDTPFCSKGAYRHHLSKVHFVKDDVIIDPIAIKSTNASNMGGVGSIGASGVGGAGSNVANISSQKQQSSSQGSSGQSPKGGPSSSSTSSSLGIPSSHSGSVSSNLVGSGNSSGGGGISGSNNSIKSPTSPQQQQQQQQQQHQTPVSSSATASTPTTNAFEESPHSKFLKYTELAKQLSSKYV